MLCEVLTRSFCVDRLGLALLTLTLACLVCPACESGVVIGSGCKNGVCPLVSGVDDCVVRSTQRSVAIHNDPNADDTHRLTAICLPTSLPRNAQGLVDLHVQWALPPATESVPGTPTHCAELPYLHSVDGAYAARYRIQFPGREVCEVDQVPVPAGTETTATLTGTGFFYDDFSTMFHEFCSTLHPARVAFNNILPLDGIILMTMSDEVLATNGEPDSGRVCRVAGDVSQLGKRCLPPLEDYSAAQSVLETRAAACGGNPCLAYHLEASVAAGCVERPFTPCSTDKPCANPRPCPTQDQLAKLAFCTCRCDAPEADAELCRCSKGFQCTPLITDADPAIAGSYCVRSDIVASTDP